MWETILGGNMTMTIPTPVAIIIGLAIIMSNFGSSMGAPVNRFPSGLPGYRPLSNFLDYRNIPHQDFLMQHFEDLNNGSVTMMQASILCIINLNLNQYIQSL